MLFSKPKRVVKRILIVEDEPLVAFDMETMLADEGYKVVDTVDTYAAAIGALDREKVDLIICDVRLHGNKNGITLAKEACKRGIPVLFATGQIPPDADKLAIGCLIKPFNMRKLKAALESINRHLMGKRPKPPRGMELYPRVPVE
ncbi:MAG TPA: response regulator [Sphingomicrobium sp.]|nr:response regulator [Sphingomicrobium sp.]